MSDSTPFDANNQPIVGRGGELRRIKNLIDVVSSGRGQLALISGEAGIGKTTLVAGLQASSAEQQVQILTGHCYDLTTTPPYGPWLEIIRAAGADQNVPLPGLLNDDGRLDGADSQLALFEEMLAYLHALTRQGRLVLVLEDMHWADQASLELLRFVARQLSRLPMLLLVVYRDDELTRQHPLSRLVPLLVREAGATRIELQRFNERATHELVAARFPLNDADERRLTRYLYQHAEGNPLFTSELLRSLQAADVVHETGSGWKLADELPHQVPSLIRQIIDDRLDRLGDGMRTTLEIAAVIGQEVPVDLWCAISGLDEAELDTRIEPALDAQLLVETPDGNGLRFSHALVREALYAGLSLLRRRALHRRIGEVLSAAPSVDPDTIAYHFEQAGDARAVEWLIRAGERAERSYALLLAAERFESALRLLERDDPMSAERGRLLHRTADLLRFADPERALQHALAAGEVARETGDRALAAHALYCQGRLHLYAGQRRQGIQEMEAAVAAIEALADASMSPSAMLFEPDATLAVALAGGGRFHDALALTERSLSQFPATPLGLDTLRIVNFNLARAIAEACLGRPEDSARSFEQMRAGLATLDHDHMKRFTSTVHELDYLVWPYQADQLVLRRELQARAEQTGARADGAMPDGFSYHHLLLFYYIYEGRWREIQRLAASEFPPEGQRVRRQAMFSALAPLARWQGDPELAWQLINDILPRGSETEPGDHEHRPALRLFRLAVELALDASDLPTARAWLAACQRWLTWSGAMLGQSELLLLQARCHLIADELDLAYEHAGWALARASAPRQPLALLAAHRFLGELAILARNLDEAGEHLGQALALADACAAPFERALTLLALAELRVISGKPAEARSMLDAARNICQRLDALPALERIETLANRIASGPPMPATNYPAGLSEREVDVLRLVGSGMSNREVADTLSLSVRTVERHISNIYGKTNLQGRAALTIFALRHNLIQPPDKR